MSQKTFHHIFRCGLVALAMADSVLNNGVNIEKISEASKRKGISKQGEIFSCKLIERNIIFLPRSIFM